MDGPKRGRATLVLGVVQENEAAITHHTQYTSHAIAGVCAAKPGQETKRPLPRDLTCDIIFFLDFQESTSTEHVL